MMEPPAGENSRAGVHGSPTDLRRYLPDDGRARLPNSVPNSGAVPLQSETDWARVDAMTDEAIARAVADDPDAAPLLTDEQLATTKVVLAGRHRRELGAGWVSARPSLPPWFGISPEEPGHQGAGPPRARGAGARAAAGDRARSRGGTAGDRVNDAQSV